MLTSSMSRTQSEAGQYVPAIGSSSALRESTTLFTGFPPADSKQGFSTRSVAATPHYQQSVRQNEHENGHGPPRSLHQVPKVEPTLPQVAQLAGPGGCKQTPDPYIKIVSQPQSFDASGRGEQT